MHIDEQVQERSLPLRDLQISKHEVHVWQLDLQDLPSPEVVAGRRHLRFRQRFYLRLLLAAYLRRPARDVRIGKTASGKPYIDYDHGEYDHGGRIGPRPPLYFSLSHAGSILLVAVCKDVPVGVDMEHVGREVRDPLRMARRYFHSAEVAWLQALPRIQLAEAWLQLWTCKEAVVKATGGGIVSGLHRFAVAMTAGGAEITAAINEPGDDVLHSLRISQPAVSADMHVALAHHHAIERIHLLHLTIAAKAPTQ